MHSSLNIGIRHHHSHRFRSSTFSRRASGKNGSCSSIFSHARYDPRRRRSNGEIGRCVTHEIYCSCVLLLWLFCETLFAAPYFLSYFNEFGGGIWNGYHYVTDSNYDWGQDLLRLQAWVNAHPEVDKIAVDYFGGGNPKYYLGAKEVDWSSSKGNPADQGIHWLAVSVNTLEVAIQPLAPAKRGTRAIPIHGSPRSGRRARHGQCPAARFQDRNFDIRLSLYNKMAPELNS